ncbi:SMP-30/gluconolactonase/LRE family protein [Allorhizocola rhizosphaerae]|uniref:SMP-30/gluconolactonase/LRE family protein n=1 Tax=Allorhizocola rhizosphaerae TaxID=1872709 RepID=UPI000E3BC92D|nr:superoxide dismutase [Allorhizocola rhizosphaerae]
MPINRRQALTSVAAAAAGSVLLPPTPARAGDLFPTEIALPNGFRPEGIAIGELPFAYFGSLADGSIYRANLATGNGAVLPAGGPGTPSVGLKLDDRGRLFVAGGNAGNARVVSARTGEILAGYTFAAAPPTFVNDVVLTPRAAYFTDSMSPLLYVLRLGRHGRLPDDFTAVPLSGDLVYQPGFNVNGIVRTPDGSALIVVQSNTASLFRVNPATGEATLVDLGGEPVTAGDGLLLLGRTLYVVQNQLNRVAVFRLSLDGRSGRLVTTATDPRFDIPTTVAAFGRRLYLPNARFSTPPTPETPYTAVAIPKP